MKTTILLTTAIAALINLVSADVVVSAGTACGDVTTMTVSTVAGTCYSIGDSDWHSAVGCGSAYKLRIHKEEGCGSDSPKTFLSGDCAAFDDGAAISSFKCVGLFD